MIRKYTPRGLYDRRNTMEEKKSLSGMLSQDKGSPGKRIQRSDESSE